MYHAADNQMLQINPQIKHRIYSLYLDFLSIFQKSQSMNIESYTLSAAHLMFRQCILNAFIDLIIKTNVPSILDVTDVILTGL